MQTIPIPANAIGRPGMVAMLQRVKPEDIDKLVAVRFAVGPMTSLTYSVKPVFAWQVLVLGDPLEVNGKLTREIVVADHCLKPVSDIDPAKVAELARLRAQQDFDAAMADLRKQLLANPITDTELESLVNKAAEQSGMALVLETVPVVVALQEIGFRCAQPDSDECFHWSGNYQGQELYVIAGVGMFGNIELTGRSNNPRMAMWSERRLLDEELRGKVFKVVLDYWREAFGSAAPVQDCLQLGLMYEQHLKEQKQIGVGLPSLYLDGEIFRATRKWIEQRHGDLNEEPRPLPDKPIHLTFHNKLLSFEVDGSVYACPATGTWVDDCQISMRMLLAMPPWRLKGHSIVLIRSMNDITLNGFALPLLEIPAYG